MKNKILIIILFSIGLSSCNNLFKHDGKSEMEKEFEAEQAKIDKEIDSIFNSVNSKYTKQDAEEEKQTFAELAKLLYKNKDTILTQINLIKAIKIKEQQIVEGAEGITIDYIFNSFTYKQNFLIDKLINMKFLQFKFQLFENNSEIQALQNYEFTYSVPNSLAQLKNIFIPYAVLNLQPGNHSIWARVHVGIEDFIDKKSSKLIDQDFVVQNINFNKPTTKLATVYIDYLESLHSDWDLFSEEGDLPDIKAKLNLGNYTIWSYQKDESYSINETSQYSITATISENDNLHIIVEDVDLVINDFMADIILKTKTAKNSEWITINKSVDHLKSCRIRYKVE